VIFPDVNLLLYAVNEVARNHRRAKLWLESVLSGVEPVGFAWAVLLAFLRLSTRPGAFNEPLSVEMAFDQIDAWVSQQGAFIVHPGPRHAQILRDLLLPLGIAGDLSSDAHLAALAIEHGAQLCSADSDFARFPGLKWANPLA
jgi:uncharacterized protein